MSNLTTIQGVAGYIDETGTAYLNLEDVAWGLGFTDRSKADKDGKSVAYVRWNTVAVYLRNLGFSQEVAKDTFIPENLFYRLAMKAKNERAERFQAVVANEILPTIRKTGGYVTGLSKELQAIFVTDKKIQTLEARVDNLSDKVDNQITVTYTQAATIQKAVASRVIDLLGGKGSAEYKFRKGSYFAQLHRDIKDRLGVPSYRDICKLDYKAALDYIRVWLPKKTA